MSPENPTERRSDSGWIIKRAFFKLVRGLHALGHDPGPQDRLHHIWRDFVPLAALILAAIAVTNTEKKADRADLTSSRNEIRLESQREGRRIAISILCGGISGTAEAGRLVLLGQLPGQMRPPNGQAPAQRSTARAYARYVVKSIIKEAGADASKVINRNGELNCDEIARTARAVPKKTK